MAGIHPDNMVGHRFKDEFVCAVCRMAIEGPYRLACGHFFVFIRILQIFSDLGENTLVRFS